MFMSRRLCAAAFAAAMASVSPALVSPAMAADDALLAEARRLGGELAVALGLNRV